MTDALSYEMAAWVLGCELPDFLALIERGLIEPVAPGQVPRESVIDLALSDVY